MSLKQKNFKQTPCPIFRRKIHVAFNFDENATRLKFENQNLTNETFSTKIRKEVNFRGIKSQLP